MTALHEAPQLAPGAALAQGYEIVQRLSRNQALDVYGALRDCRCVAELLAPGGARRGAPHDAAADGGPAAVTALAAGDRPVG